MIKQHPFMTFPGLIKLVVLGGIASVLIWLVITRGFVASFAKTAPQRAFAMRSNDPVALLNLADKAINPADRKKESDSPDTKQLEKWIRKALLEAPVNARAFRLLGQLSEKKGETERTYQNMKMSLNFSIRESVASYWLMQHFYQKKEFGSTLDYANNLLWHQPQLTKSVMPFLASIAEKKQEREKVVTILAQAPHWRSAFFAFLPLSITDAHTPLRLFMSLRKTTAPPKKHELRTYFNFLNHKKLYSLSYYSWLQFLPPEHLARTGFLFNGNFDMPLDNMPFNWVIRKGKGAYSEIVPHPEERQKKALSIRLSRGHSDFGRISQIVMLTPGLHTFEGRQKGALIGQRGLRWRIECLGKRRKKISESSMFTGRKRNWEKFEISFTIPEKNCPAQYISLLLDARTRSEKLASGRIWYDRLKITLKRRVQ